MTNAYICYADKNRLEGVWLSAVLKRNGICCVDSAETADCFVLLLSSATTAESKEECAKASQAEKAVYIFKLEELPTKLTADECLSAYTDMDKAAARLVTALNKIKELPSKVGESVELDLEYIDGRKNKYHSTRLDLDLFGAAIASAITRGICPELLESELGVSTKRAKELFDMLLASGLVGEIVDDGTDGKPYHRCIYFSTDSAMLMAEDCKTDSFRTVMEYLLIDTWTIVRGQDDETFECLKLLIESCGKFAPSVARAMICFSANGKYELKAGRILQGSYSLKQGKLSLMYEGKPLLENRTVYIEKNRLTVCCDDGKEIKMYKIADNFQE